MARLFVPLLLLAIVASAARSEIIQFEMEGLTGDSVDSVKVDTLVYSGSECAVNSVSFRVSGVVNDLGEICCGGPEYCQGQTSPWIMVWWATIEKSDNPDPINGDWVASMPYYLQQLGPFDQSDIAENRNSFESISGGDVFYVELFFGTGKWLGECELYRPPSGTALTVTVTMDVSCPLPAGTTTWGRIKALYN